MASGPTTFTKAIRSIRHISRRCDKFKVVVRLEKLVMRVPQSVQIHCEWARGGKTVRIDDHVILTKANWSGAFQGSETVLLATLFRESHEAGHFIDEESGKPFDYTCKMSKLRMIEITDAVEQRKQSWGEVQFNISDAVKKRWGVWHRMSVNLLRTRDPLAKCEFSFTAFCANTDAVTMPARRNALLHCDSVTPTAPSFMSRSSSGGRRRKQQSTSVAATDRTPATRRESTASRLFSRMSARGRGSDVSLALTDQFLTDPAKPKPTILTPQGPLVQQLDEASESGIPSDIFSVPPVSEASARMSDVTLNPRVRELGALRRSSMKGEERRRRNSLHESVRSRMSWRECDDSRTSRAGRGSPTSNADDLFSFGPPKAVLDQEVVNNSKRIDDILVQHAEEMADLQTRFMREKETLRTRNADLEGLVVERDTEVETLRAQLMEMHAALARAHKMVDLNSVDAEPANALSGLERALKREVNSLQRRVNRSELGNSEQQSAIDDLWNKHSELTGDYQNRWTEQQVAHSLSHATDTAKVKALTQQVSDMKLQLAEEINLRRSAENRVTELKKVLSADDPSAARRILEADALKAQQGLEDTRLREQQMRQAFYDQLCALEGGLTHYKDAMKLEAHRQAQDRKAFKKRIAELEALVELAKDPTDVKVESDKSDAMKFIHKIDHQTRRPQLIEYLRECEYQYHAVLSERDEMAAQHRAMSESLQKKVTNYACLVSDLECQLSSMRKKELDKDKEGLGKQFLRMISVTSSGKKDDKSKRKREGKPSEREGKPSEREGKPSEREGRPSLREGKPNEGGGKPNEGGGKPNEEHRSRREPSKARGAKERSPTKSSKHRHESACNDRNR
ncbi:MAG: uncharacterized protein KVP18_001830 [Porospora cf. gigantea A]|uniref:uncharacterized protein n=1 Tax=Porospora cf. gigantea A TaxID=2853593 RepID=UPI003559E65C|nr:MAG: hypothetical protein KVP18_001830 [Porospora cf. gigantea A]